MPLPMLLRLQALFLCLSSRVNHSLIARRRNGYSSNKRSSPVASQQGMSMAGMLASLKKRIWLVMLKTWKMMHIEWEQRDGPARVGEVSLQCFGPRRNETRCRLPPRGALMCKVENSHGRYSLCA